MKSDATEAYCIPFSENLREHLHNELQDAHLPESSLLLLGKKVLEEFGWSTALSAEIVRSRQGMFKNGCCEAEVESFTLGLCDGFELGLGVVALVLRIRLGDHEEPYLSTDEQDWYTQITTYGALYEATELNDTQKSEVTTDALLIANDNRIKSDNGFTRIFEKTITTVAMNINDAQFEPLDELDAEKVARAFINGCEHALASISGFITMLQERDRSLREIETFLNNLSS